MKKATLFDEAYYRNHIEDMLDLSIEMRKLSLENEVSKNIFISAIDSLEIVKECGYSNLYEEFRKKYENIGLYDKTTNSLINK